MMADGATIGAVLILAATAYWLVSTEAMARFAGGITSKRMMTAGGFGAGLLYGDVVLKAAIGMLGATGALALDGSINLSGSQFALLGIAIIGLFIVLGGD